MASLQPVRGTHDLLADEFRRHDHVVKTAEHVASLHGFHHMATPIFEFTDVFARTLGETSDVVSKEMYTFEDRGGERLTLRPEGTAGIARAVISNGLQQALPLKAFYYGPMFRYERPQKGRQRQFHQFGIELIGAEQVGADLDVIALADHILSALGLGEEITLELNTLGDTESRQAYRDALVAYFSRFKDDLSDDSKERLERNPLRILDSKDEGDRKIVADAPSFASHLNDLSRKFFDDLRDGLEVLGIAFKHNERLVRGLDYYCHTCFEFTTNRLGAQGTVLAGGRYDGLIKTMGGPQTPGVGFAAGVERLAMLAGDGAAPAPRPVALVPMGEAAEKLVLQLSKSLRRDGVMVDLAYSGNMKKRMKRADKVSARAAVVIGDDEIAKSVVAVRDLDSGHQEEVTLDGLADALKRLY